MCTAQLVRRRKRARGERSIATQQCEQARKAEDPEREGHRIVELGWRVVI